MVDPRKLKTLHFEKQSQRHKENEHIQEPIIPIDTFEVLSDHGLQFILIVASLSAKGAPNMAPCNTTNNNDTVHVLPTSSRAKRVKMQAAP